MPIVKTETIDGFKFYFDEDSWIMIRPSGTEPVLRTYAEAKNQDKCFEILKRYTKLYWISIEIYRYNKARAIYSGFIICKTNT